MVKMGIIKKIGNKNLFEHTDEAILSAQSLLTLIMCIECEKYRNGVCAYMICELPQKES